MDVALICSDLVKIRSENPPGFTDEIIEYIRQFCDSIGLKTEIVSKGRRHNLISRKPKGKLLLCGHVDVVPALDDGWNFPPFSGLIEDGLVYGRGATDMKGGCAVILSALEACIEIKGDTLADIAFVCDEEGKGEFGMEQLLEGGIIHPSDCLIAEPTPRYTPIIGEKGILRTHINFSGGAGHASLHPISGNSAIMQACKFLSFCQEVHTRTWQAAPLVADAIGATVQALETELHIPADDADKILSRVMYNPGTIKGGERVNIVAQQCELELDMRIPWGCNPDALMQEMRTVIPTADLRVRELARPSLSEPGWLCDLVCRSIRSVIGGEPRPGVTQAASDARYLRERGVEVVVYGPGDLSLLHSVNEKIPIHMLKETSEIYTHILTNLPPVNQYL